MSIVSAADTPGPDLADQRNDQRSTRWAIAQRVFWALVALVTIGLIVETGRHLDWAGAWSALRAVPSGVLLWAAAFAALGHLLYSSYDVLGHQSGVPPGQSQTAVPSRWVLSVGFVSFAFKLNLGTVVGGIALRYRLYSRLGLALEETTRILAASVLTNWIGYGALAGMVLLASPPPLPASWGIGPGGLRIAGLALCACAVAYAAICHWAEGREWRWRQHVLRLPSTRVALLQLVLSSAHWALTAAVCWVLLRDHVDYFSVLSALLVSAVAGLITHVPGGLGVLEAVFIALLQSRVGQADLLAALLGFRAIYYLAPLGLASLLFFVVDRHRRDHHSSARSTAAPGHMEVRRD